jgi:hypothetical protein
MTDRTSDGGSEGRTRAEGIERMRKRRLEESPHDHRGGQVSYLLLGKGGLGSEDLSVTWVEGAPRRGSSVSG